jgi:hypothetical protein
LLQGALRQAQFPKSSEGTYAANQGMVGYEFKSVGTRVLCLLLSERKGAVILSEVKV